MGSGANDRTKRRQAQRLVRARRRAAVGSALGFAAFLGLVGQHAVGSSKAAPPEAAPTRPVGAGTRYFDDRTDGLAFDDGSAAPLPPPVAQTHVS